MPEPRVTAAQKDTVLRRAGGACEYCKSQADFSPDAFAAEHIVPRSKGGLSRLDNLALSCQGCNNAKFISIESVDPATGEAAPLFHPRQQDWNEHFAWSEDFSLVLGLTPTGRATVEKLRLNRTGVVNLRQVLHEVRKHPPEASS